MIRYRTIPTCLALLAVAMATACSPSPGASPTPSATAMFESEQEAFAAAEETYRAYIDADNSERVGGASSRTRDYLIGLALNTDTDAREYLSSRGLTITGDSIVASFTAESADLATDGASVDARVCLDVSGSTVLDASGTDVTPPDRIDVVPLEVKMIEVEDDLRISESNSAEESFC